MTDKLIERLRASRATWKDAKSAPTDLEAEAIDRILADAKIIKAAEALAEALCAEEKTAGQGAWAKLDACEVTDNALAAYRAAASERDT